MIISTSHTNSENNIKGNPIKIDIYAALTFIIQKDHLLLIRKKRDPGAGKISGPGGKLDPGESPLACAIRETQEELKITPQNLKPAGENIIEYPNKTTMKIYIYRASEFHGTPTKTEEADPIWCPKNKIPYEQMWQDNKYWVPLMLKKTYFTGNFIFNNEILIKHKISTTSSMLDSK